MGKLSENIRGAFLMMGSMAAFTVNDASMKALADELPLVQAVFLRGAMTSVLIYLLARLLGGLRFDLGRRDWALVIARSLTEVGAAWFFITALFNMPIANASAILQILPLTVTLAGALFLGEAVGWRRMAAILIGFLGVLLIVRPGFQGFNIYSVYALISVVLVTARDLLVRRMSVRVPTMTVALVNAVVVSGAFGVVSLALDWAPMSGLAAAQLAIAAVSLVGGYVFSVSAMRAGEIAIIAPFRYTSLLWALVLGLVLFAEWPDPLTLAGSAIVVATGIYAFHRERRLAQTRKTQVPAGAAH